jgi:hypothetical protein
LACAWRTAELEGLLSRYVAGPELVERLAEEGKGQINTDDRNVIEYGFARTVGKSSTGFSIRGLREQAAELRAHRPAIAESDVDWDRVEGHRQILFAVSDGTIVLPREAGAEQKARAAVLERYRRADTRGMVAAWEASPYEPIFPTETALLGLGYADLGDERAMGHVGRLRSFRPVEADAVEAYLRWRQGRPEEAADAAERVFLALRASPWCFSHALELCFDVAAGVAPTDRAAARRMQSALAEPFAVYVSEEDRRMTAVKVAACLGVRDSALALEAFEPHVPWEEPFLRARCQVYAAVGHPLAGRAEEDLASYRR